MCLWNKEVKLSDDILMLRQSVWSESRGEKPHNVILYLKIKTQEERKKTTTVLTPHLNIETMKKINERKKASKK